ncbi:MAG: hypothetical protein Q4F84_09025, partial [Fibrobacter sp.]|nr:hypothetical protein [Fibrobacter sp.]
GNFKCLDKRTIDDVSDALHDLLREFAPDFVNALNAFAEKVVFIPVSATGKNPKKNDAEDNSFGFDSGSLQPVWIGVPLLYSLAVHDYNKSQQLIKFI